MTKITLHSPVFCSMREKYRKAPENSRVLRVYEYIMAMADEAAERGCKRIQTIRAMWPVALTDAQVLEVMSWLDQDGFTVYMSEPQPGLNVSGW